jgi:hypothetical protein
MSTNKLAMVADECNPSYSRGWGWRTEVRGRLWTKTWNPTWKKQLKEEMTEVWLKWWSTCLSSKRTWIQTLIETERENMNEWMRLILIPSCERINWYNHSESKWAVFNNNDMLRCACQCSLPQACAQRYSCDTLYFPITVTSSISSPTSSIEPCCAPSKDCMYFPSS